MNDVQDALLALGRELEHLDLAPADDEEALGLFPFGKQQFPLFGLPRPADPAQAVQVLFGSPGKQGAFFNDKSSFHGWGV
ncbi:hypothetical protein DESUT3_18480 [Desulfuromonas versatilis]|uniref:Uncharacterized protein n=1 Tax=Desulfuromonas versatilis TaxID=2802975 RepID=A0ABM8HVM9_9BACT|nr:hypothetical protein DESUT3_18480 [Desulfuromonas versatilis]